MCFDQVPADGHLPTGTPSPRAPGGPPFCYGAATHPVKFIRPKAAARIKLQTRSVRLSTAGSPGPKPPAGAPCMLPPPGELQGLVGMAQASGPRSSWRPAAPAGEWASGSLGRQAPLPTSRQILSWKGERKRGRRKTRPLAFFLPWRFTGPACCEHQIHHLERKIRVTRDPRKSLPSSLLI